MPDLRHFSQAKKTRSPCPWGATSSTNTFAICCKAYPDVQLSRNMAREIKEKYGFVHDVNETAVVSLPVHGKPTPIRVTEPLKAACRMIVPPILEGLRELIGRFDPEFQPRMLNNILLGGGGSQLKGLDRVIEGNLQEYGAGKVKRLGDPVFAAQSAPSSWPWIRPWNSGTACKPTWVQEQWPRKRAQPATREAPLVEASKPLLFAEFSNST